MHRRLGELGGEEAEAIAHHGRAAMRGVARGQHGTAQHRYLPTLSDPVGDAEVGGEDDQLAALAKTKARGSVDGVDAEPLVEAAGRTE